jgi:uncharacterized protein YndB with AHSA1/START domain
MPQILPLPSRAPRRGRHAALACVLLLAAAQAAGTAARAAAAAAQVALAVPGGAAGAAAAQPAVERSTRGAVTVTITRAPEKRLDFEVVVPASLDEVWQAFTTADGLVGWLTPAAKVELRLGGPWEADFPGGKTGGGTILSFLPREMLAVAALAPEAFPNVRREHTQAVFRFEPVDATHTRVRLAQIGWKDGSEWDAAFAYLADGNAQLLNSLHHRFATGPVDWKAVFGQHPSPGR